MSFVYSLKLFGSNWTKAIKLFLYYLVIWGLCFVLLLPVFFAFKNIVIENLSSIDITTAFSGAIFGSIGKGIHIFAIVSRDILLTVFSVNLPLAIYGLFVIFILLPFLLNVGKYTFCDMLYLYMTSKAKVGFFSALVKSLRNSVCYAICKTIHNLIFFGIIFSCGYYIALIDNSFFITYLLHWVVFLLIIVLFTFNQLLVLGWCPAMIVFNCNVFSAYKKGLKAVKRHFCITLMTTSLFFILFWALIFIFGLYTMFVLVPFMTILLCVYEMVVFFTSQGMRFYFNETNILTPKKLEEVDNINKTTFIL